MTPASFSTTLHMREQKGLVRRALLASIGFIGLTNQAMAITVAKARKD